MQEDTMIELTLKKGGCLVRPKTSIDVCSMEAKAAICDQRNIANLQCGVSYLAEMLSQDYLAF